MERQVKLAVILHADIVGSTKLVRDDEVFAHRATRSAFQSLESSISEHEGSALEVRGDALIGQFARPSDAILAAIHFQNERGWRQESNDRIQVRIGIAMGEVVIADNTVTGAGVVLAQRLEQIAPPEGVVVSSAVREAVSGNLPVRYVDLGTQTLKGFDLPQVAYKVEHEAVVTPGVRAVTQTTERSPLEGTSGARIAVLPFRNLSKDEDQEFFADGLSEDITLALTASRSFSVLAASATLPYKSMNVTPAVAGNELEAHYVLDGSVRRAGGRIRVAVELVAVETQVQVWAERYDRPYDDVFAVQDDITTTVVAILEPEIDDQEMRRVIAAKASDFGAYELAQRGFWHLAKKTFEAYEASLPLFDASIESDGRYARAYAGISQAKYAAGNSFWEPREAALHEALEYGALALECDPKDPRALRYHGGTNIALGKLDEGMATVRRAIAAQPSYATAYSVLAFGLSMNGNFEDAIQSVETTKRLRPGDRALHKCIMSAAISEYELGNYIGAAEVCEQSEQMSDTFWKTHAVKAAALGQIGGDSAATNAAVKRLSDFLPSLTERELAKLLPFRNSDHVDHLAEGLKKAGTIISPG